jgi:hypothetical protein
VPELFRLPQDVGPAHSGDTRGVPDLTKLRGDLGEYMAMRHRLDDHDAVNEAVKPNPRDRLR